jgi:hypothetical protein
MLRMARARNLNRAIPWRGEPREPAKGRAGNCVSASWNYAIHMPARMSDFSVNREAVAG